MADKAEGGATIVIKRIKKGHAAAHGGAWKVAYADFVTAMMAFFLLLWLLNAVTEEQLSGISDYFAPTTVSSSKSGAGGVLGGQSIAVDGAAVSDKSTPTAPTTLPPPTIGSGGQDLTDPKENPNTTEDPTASAKQDAQQQEEEQFQEAMDKLQEAIQNMPDAQMLQKSLLVDNTLEGLRIQIVDQEGLAMFPSGSSQMFQHTKKIIETVSKIVETMPQKISISGHTDSTQFADQTGYTNWELSADRALASRRVLLATGVNPERIDRVVGKADTDPLLKDDPKAARNRRIAIVMLREFKPGEGVPLEQPQDTTPFALQ
ncbi:MAG: hypothetical protein A2516_02460 [Alphaproteobacteria bacterium RIFOXYD12_FULL_60_8]|nr:MAG: hypothetical protein A2516_02460 [Alphaproteobacteria bacterium RIFOXYD12_FULL_60_8]